MEIFDIAYYKFADKFFNFKMANRVRWTKVEKLLNLNARCYLRFFGVADYESTSIFLKLKMADTI